MFDEQYKALLDDVNDDGWSALHIGAYFGRTECVMCYLQSDHVRLEHIFKKSASKSLPHSSAYSKSLVVK